MEIISILIPTLNSEKVLESCLTSIRNQNYPQDNVEIIIADGGSTDQTINIANKFKCKAVENTLKTGEAGKKVALLNASGEYCALIDSDNILPSNEWLSQMIAPLREHKEAVGSEPWEYTLREEDGFITRYCALIGVNDPLCYFLGNYDRMNLLTNKWTEIKHKEYDYEKFILIEFDKSGLPTIGANGTLFRTSFLKEYATTDYLFDIDILSGYLQKENTVKFIKTKNGIIHTFCVSSITKFIRKQRRRVQDYLFHKKFGDRSYVWESNTNFFGVFKFIISCIFVFPLIYQSFKGYFRKQDFAWFFHILACEITLFEYGFGFLLKYI